MNQLLYQNDLLLCYNPFLIISGQELTHPGVYHPYRKPKRIRTAFSPTQLLVLERSFDRNHYVVGTERKDLAKSLGLSETQVRSCLYQFKFVLNDTNYFCENVSVMYIEQIPNTHCTYYLHWEQRRRETRSFNGRLKPSSDFSFGKYLVTYLLALMSLNG